MKTTHRWALCCALIAACATDPAQPISAVDAPRGDSPRVDAPSMDAMVDQEATVDQPALPDALPDLAPDAPVLPIDYPAIVFVHGNGPAGATDFETMIGRFVGDGWPAERLFARTFDDPRWDCNVDNAAVVSRWVDDLRAASGASRIHIVAHSMGSLSSRYYMRDLGGHSIVHTYVTLGGMHHGLFAPCLSPMGIACTWDELCQDRAFITALNEAPVTPGPARWFSMFGADDAAVPNDSSRLEGADNTAFVGIDHGELLTDEAVYLAIRTALE